MEEINSSYEIIESHEDPSRFRDLGLTGFTIIKHSALLVLTFFSIAFTEWMIGFLPEWSNAIIFAFLLLAFLGTHEFGHYFASVYHKVKTTLPYFIPLPVLSPIGTMGAVIRIKERVDNSKKLFDIGVSGPVVGFVVSLVLLLIGFFTLPGPEYIFHLPGHEALKEFIYQFHRFPNHVLTHDPNEQVVMLGHTLLYSFLAMFFHNVPPMWEMYHYPFLFAGWLGLFFTALNLTPIGQLDGGHVIYGLFGYETHKKIARVVFAVLTVLSGLGIVPELAAQFNFINYGFNAAAWIIWAAALFLILRKAYAGEHNWIAPVWGFSLIASALILYLVLGMKDSNGYTVWFIWTLFVLFFVKIEHPPVRVEEPLSKGRRILGWASLAILVLCISPNPMYLLNQ